MQKLINFRLEKWSALAGMRFILASIVAFQHLGERIPLGVFSFIPRFGPFEAVLGFLAISGYSIASSYRKQPEGFLWRRVCRIYPIYLWSLVLAWVVFTWKGVAVPSWGELILNALLLNQIFTSQSFVIPAWSLSLEFWLYCFAPLLIRLSERGSRIIMYGSFILYILYTCGRSLLHYPYFAGLGFGLNIPLLAFVWIAGFRLAASNNKTTAMRDVWMLLSGHILLTAGIQLMAQVKHGLFVQFIYQDVFGYLMRYSTLVFVCVGFALFAFNHEFAKSRPSVILRWLGDISYPLYLLHISFYVILISFNMKMPFLIFCLAALGAAVSYFLLDRYSQKRHLRAA